MKKTQKNYIPLRENVGTNKIYVELTQLFAMHVCTTIAN